MTYKNRKDSSVSIKIITKTPKRTVISHINYVEIPSVYGEVSLVEKTIESIIEDVNKILQTELDV